MEKWNLARLPENYYFSSAAYYCKNGHAFGFLTHYLDWTPLLLVRLRWCEGRCDNGQRVVGENTNNGRGNRADVKGISACSGTLLLLAGCWWEYQPREGKIWISNQKRLKVTPAICGWGWTGFKTAHAWPGFMRLYPKRPGLSQIRMLGAILWSAMTKKKIIKLSKPKIFRLREI